MFAKRVLSPPGFGGLIKTPVKITKHLRLRLLRCYWQWHRHAGDIMKTSLLVIVLVVSDISVARAQHQAANQAAIDTEAAKLASARDEAIAKLAEKYKPIITNLESERLAIVQKYKPIVQESNTLEVLKNSFLVTNFVKPGPNYRVVNGQTYNVTNSELWGSPIELAGNLPKLANNGHPLRYEVIAQKIGKDKVVCDVAAITYWFETYTAAQQDESRRTIKTIVVYHYPEPEQLVTGQAISFRCMRVANFIANEISCEAYDCGVPPTSNVPEVVQGSPDQTTLKKIEVNQKKLAEFRNELSAIEPKIVQVNSDFDKERAAIIVEYEAKVYDIPSEIANAKKQAVADKVLKSNQDLADKGDAYGLLRMGERYRDGDGVPKDLTKARDYLTKAAASGSVTAADELKKLPANQN